MADSSGRVIRRADKGETKPAPKGAKAQRTRAAILDATLACYNDFGFARTTQEKIAERAGLSMGAITYHFGSIHEITRAAIGHAFSERLTRHEQAIRTAMTVDGDFDTALEIYWNEVIDPLFIACHELAVAARTDDVLKAEFLPAQETFQREWNRNLLALHPEWGEAGELFRFAVEYSTWLCEGMALHHIMFGANASRLQDTRDFMKDNLAMLLGHGKGGGSVASLLAAGRAARSLHKQG